MTRKYLKLSNFACLLIRWTEQISQIACSHESKSPITSLVLMNLKVHNISVGLVTTALSRNYHSSSAYKNEKASVIMPPNSKSLLQC